MKSYFRSPVGAPRLHVYSNELFGLESEAQRLAFSLLDNLFEDTGGAPSRASVASTDSLNGIKAFSGDPPSPFSNSCNQHLNQERVVSILVDQRATMLFGSGRRAKAVVAAQAAALIVWRAAAWRYHLGAILFSDRRIEGISPRWSRLRPRLILHVLLTMNQALAVYSTAPSRLGTLNEALQRAVSASPNGSGVFLITDGSGWTKETTELIKRLSDKNKMTVILVCDPCQIDFKSIKCFSQGVARNERGAELVNCHRFRTEGTSLELTPIPFDRLPREVSIVLLHTRADAVKQLSRIRLKTSAPSAIHLRTNAFKPDFQPIWAPHGAQSIPCGDGEPIP